MRTSFSLVDTFQGHAASENCSLERIARTGKLYHVKRLIAGLNQFNRPEISKALQDLKKDKVPFVNLPERKGQHQHAVTEEVMKEVQWLRPEQPAEIEFVERTPHGRLRHASFRRLLPRVR